MPRKRKKRKPLQPPEKLLWERDFEYQFALPLDESIYRIQTVDGKKSLGMRIKIDVLLDGNNIDLYFHVGTRFGGIWFVGRGEQKGECTQISGKTGVDPEIMFGIVMLIVMALIFVGYAVASSNFFGAILFFAIVWGSTAFAILYGNVRLPRTYLMKTLESTLQE